MDNEESNHGLMIDKFKAASDDINKSDNPPKPEDTEHVSFWERLKAGNIDDDSQASKDDPKSAYNRWGAGKKDRMAREIESEKTRESRRNESKPAETPEPSKPVNPTVAPREEFAAESVKLMEQGDASVAEKVAERSPKPDQTPIKEQASTKKATQPVPKTITRQPAVTAMLPSPASQAEAPMEDKVSTQSYAPVQRVRGSATPASRGRPAQPANEIAIAESDKVKLPADDSDYKSRDGIMSRMLANDAALNKKIIAGAKKVPQEESILDRAHRFMTLVAAGQ